MHFQPGAVFIFSLIRRQPSSEMKPSGGIELAHGELTPPGLVHGELVHGTAANKELLNFHSEKSALLPGNAFFFPNSSFPDVYTIVTPSTIRSSAIMSCSPSTMNIALPA